MNAVALRASGHYLSFLDVSDRVGTDYVAAIVAGERS